MKNCLNHQKNHQFRYDSHNSVIPNHWSPKSDRPDLKSSNLAEIKPQLVLRNLICTYSALKVSRDLTTNDSRRTARSLDKIFRNKESSKIVLKLFLKKPSTSYETPSSYESTDTKIFKKIERELAFWAVQSIWVQLNAFLTLKKTKTGTSVKLEWKFMTLAIFSWVGLVQASALVE